METCDLHSYFEKLATKFAPMGLQLLYGNRFEMHCLRERDDVMKLNHVTEICAVAVPTSTVAALKQYLAGS